MLKLFITEIKYNMLSLLIILLFSIGTGIISLVNFRFFLLEMKEELIAGSILFFLIIYLSMYFIWSLRIKEKRDRQNMLLPLSIKSIGVVNIIFAYLPVIFVVVLFKILHQQVVPEWNSLTGRIINSMGFIAVLTSSFLLFHNVRFMFSSKYYGLKYLALTLLIIIIFFISFLS